MPRTKASEASDGAASSSAAGDEEDGEKKPRRLSPPMSTSTAVAHSGSLESRLNVRVFRTDYSYTLGRGAMPAVMPSRARS